MFYNILSLSIIATVIVSIVSIIQKVQVINSSDAEVVSLVVPTIPTKPMTAYIAEVMQTCKAQGSEARQQVVAEQLARITESAFTARSEQEAFVLLVCIESRFDPLAKSKAGARGLAQIMPQFFPKFAESCGLKGVDSTDIDYAEINLRVGSCHFSQLLRQYEGNVGLALAAYNSGAGSRTTKALALGGEGHPETSGYLAKYLVIQQKIQGGK